MSSLFHQPRKHDVATLAGYVLSAASLAMIVYILIEGWL
ncbi:hypothetical protein EV665_104341 [Shinella granuli]|jgi:hypothetical protein|uniref:Uncharacterized protein n=1 Tax=Shinella granuli TaxID=323621 RepID=A0A4R2CZ57_SHIGR|nr:hypothetical protein EV665_104341 [Shinella granuli]